MMGLVAAGIVAIIVVNATFVVKETEQALVFQFGDMRRTVLNPGLEFKVPFIQNVVYVDKRILEADSKPEEIQSKDKEPMLVDSFTRWRVVDIELFYKKVKTIRNARTKVNLIVNSNLRQKLGLQTSKEIVSGDRGEIMNGVLTDANTEAQALGIEVVDVRIKRADWPQNISNAVFERMKAERNKEAKEIRAEGEEEAQETRATAEQERTIILAEAQRDAQKLRGEGDAESIRITASAFSKDRKFYGFIRSLEAYETSLRSKDTFMVLDPSMKFFEHMGLNVK
jgi:membrane protease subunit HflC